MAIIGHGIDLVDVERVARLVREHGDRFLERCFTPAESEYASGSARRMEHLAARFAAKEAALKALGCGLTAGISWTDIEVTRDSAGRPGLVLVGRAAEVAQRAGVRVWWVSLSHAGGFASASVIAED